MSDFYDNYCMSPRDMDFYAGVYKEFVHIAKAHAPMWFWNPEIVTWEVGPSAHKADIPGVNFKSPFGEFHFLFLGYSERRDSFTLYHKGWSISLRGDSFANCMDSWKDKIRRDLEWQREDLIKKETLFAELS